MRCFFIVYRSPMEALESWCGRRVDIGGGAGKENFFERRDALIPKKEKNLNSQLFVSKLFFLIFIIHFF